MRGGANFGEIFRHPFVRVDTYIMHVCRNFLFLFRAHTMGIGRNSRDFDGNSRTKQWPFVRELLNNKVVMSGRYVKREQWGLRDFFSSETRLPLFARNTAAGKGEYKRSIRIRWKMLYEILYEIRNVLNYRVKEWLRNGFDQFLSDSKLILASTLMQWLCEKINFAWKFKIINFFFNIKICNRSISQFVLYTTSSTINDPSHTNRGSFYKFDRISRI